MEKKLNILGSPWFVCDKCDAQIETGETYFRINDLDLCDKCFKKVGENEANR